MYIVGPYLRLMTDNIHVGECFMCCASFLIGTRVESKLCSLVDGADGSLPVLAG